VWGSRLSILFGIIRIDPSSERRKQLFWAAVAFIVVSLVLIAQIFWVCEAFFYSGKYTPNLHCHSSLQIAVCQLISKCSLFFDRYSTHITFVTADIIADSILLFSPLPLFRNLINKALRRRLTLIFTTCVVTTVVCSQVCF
jgi:hypothetical protein